MKLVLLQKKNQIKLKKKYQQLFHLSKDNPQYLLEVEHQIEIFCLLTQLIAPSVKRVPKIGFCIFKYENKIVGENDIIPEMVAIGRYSRERAISLNCTLAAGKYILLLSTYHPGEYGKFLFNIWFPNNVNVSSAKALVMTKITRQFIKGELSSRLSSHII